MEGTYELTEDLGIDGPPPDVEAKAFRFAGELYEVHKQFKTGNTVVTYTESGSFATSGTDLSLTAKCACTQVGTTAPACTKSPPVTKFSYTAAADGLVTRRIDAATKIEIQETFVRR